jgi:uronate dehydrogenase
LGDIVDETAIGSALEGVDTLVHLAAHPDDAPFSTLVGPNVMGLFQVLNAARVKGVTKVILASSIQALGRRTPSEEPARVTEARPDNHYGLTKLWAENMGEMYARKFGMSVLAVRIAWMVRNLDEAEYMDQIGRYDIYLSARDAGRFFLKAVEAKLDGFAIAYAASRGTERRFDLEPAKSLIGYEPMDRWPEGLGFPFTPKNAHP